jgi:DNA-binding SARP family transcriptional activator
VRDLEYRILGTLEVSRQEEKISIDAGRQRTVLTTLLLEGNHVVSLDRLAWQLWGELPPPRAKSTIQSLVFRLRKTLDHSTDRPVLITMRPGYLLVMSRAQLDVNRFNDLARHGRNALLAGELSGASTSLRQALALWRGDPLADVSGVGFQQVEVPCLREQWLQAVEDRIEVDLLLGRHAELIVELPTLIIRHPLRERLYGQLMLALYRAGRQAEALDVFQELRRRMVDDLAIEPAPALQHLYQQVLLHEPELDRYDAQSSAWPTGAGRLTLGGVVPGMAGHGSRS